MRIAVSSDERTGVAVAIVEQLRARGHEPLPHGALSDSERDDWAWASEAAARDVAEGRADQAVVCCWTGTGASIAANKVRGVRAALCNDLHLAELSRRHNDANVLAMGGRIVAPVLAQEIVRLWLATPFDGGRHARRVEQLGEIERGER
jgi:ribose 5-phosphate isomerase B